MQTTLRCYVCGRPIADPFYLVAMSRDVDRVFIVDEACLDRVERPSVALRVEAAPKQ